MKFCILTFLVVFLFQESDKFIVGKWQIKSYDAIDKIKNSPGYMFGDENSRDLIDKQFEAILTNGQYNFGKDTLHYTDIQGTTLLIRRALWTIEKNVITINEIDRTFERHAFIHFLSKDSLAISPIIQGKVGDSKIIFSKMD